jgi:antitoxin (DNA-binding transcriptional repressor) of toxin-antitoxin stability system
MRSVGVLEAKTHLSSLIEEIGRDGEDIVITRHGKPVASLSRPPVQSEGAKSSRADVIERFRALRERIARENPDIVTMSWEDLKLLARK